MVKSVSTRLIFQGDAHEAIEYYVSIFDDFLVEKEELQEVLAFLQIGFRAYFNTCPGIASASMPSAAPAPIARPN